MFFVAALYSTVGHAGASGYLACMALAGMAPKLMKPSALALNIIVAVIATYKFLRAGCFSWRTFWPFALTSVLFSFLGGAVMLPGFWYRKVVSVILVYAGARLLMTASTAAGREVHTPPLIPALCIGAVLGFISGLTGVGGGIFLSPVLLLAGWAETRATSGVSAVFILVNSIAGLAGDVFGERKIAAVLSDPAAVLFWGVCAAAGGWIGSHYGSRSLPTVTIRRFLAAVVLLAAAKMWFTH
jgi:uncharacterized membrane protein YfcA